MACRTGHPVRQSPMRLFARASTTLHGTLMSAPLPDNISPLAPHQFLEPHLPKVQLALRIVLALLVLLYVYLVPARLTLTPYMVFLLGVIVYIGIQSLLGLTVILTRTTPLVLNSITATDLAAALLALLNDPAPFPPTLVLVAIALALAAAQHRQQAFTLIAAVVSLIWLPETRGRDLDAI